MKTAARFMDEAELGSQERPQRFFLFSRLTGPIGNSNTHKEDTGGEGEHTPPAWVHGGALMLMLTQFKCYITHDDSLLTPRAADTLSRKPSTNGGREGLSAPRPRK